MLDLQGLDLTSSVPLAPVSMTSVVSISQDSGPIVSTNIQENSREQLLLGSSEGMKDIDAGKSEVSCAVVTVIERCISQYILLYILHCTREMHLSTLVH